MDGRDQGKMYYITQDDLPNKSCPLCFCQTFITRRHEGFSHWPQIKPKDTQTKTCSQVLMPTSTYTRTHTLYDITTLIWCQNVQFKNKCHDSTFFDIKILHQRCKGARFDYQKYLHWNHIPHFLLQSCRQEIIQIRKGNFVVIKRYIISS